MQSRNFIGCLGEKATAIKPKSNFTNCYNKQQQQQQHGVYK